MQRIQHITLTLASPDDNLSVYSLNEPDTVERLLSLIHAIVLCCLCDRPNITDTFGQYDTAAVIHVLLDLLAVKNTVFCHCCAPLFIIAMMSSQDLLPTHDSVLPSGPI